MDGADADWLDARARHADVTRARRVAERLGAGRPIPLAPRRSWEDAAMNKIALGLTLALATMGCGGSQKPAAANESPCVAMAANIATQLKAAAAAEGEDSAEMAARLAPAMQKVMGERCQADAWSDDAIACMSKADAAGMEACGEMLTPAQKSAVEQAMEAEMGGSKDEAAMEAPAAGAPPPSDPCGGGE